MTPSAPAAQIRPGREKQPSKDATPHPPSIKNPSKTHHFMTDHKSTSKKLLSQRQIKVLAFWAGDLIAAARAAGYKEPEQAAYRLMKNPLFVKTLQQKQESMAEQSGKILGERIAVSRTEVLNRLWDLARMTPEQTNGTIYGQIKATETLAYVFDIKIVRPADVDDLLRGRTTDEVDYFVANGYFPEDALESPEESPDEVR
jgi:hypothetical protein